MASSDRPLLSLRLAVLALFLVGCPGSAKYSAHAAYSPISSQWESAELRVRGTRLPGHDMGDECEGTITVKTKGVERSLAVRYAALQTTVTATTPGGLAKTGSPLDAGALLAVGPAMTTAEAEDILQAFEAACLGPKMGFPATPTLRKVTEDSHYD